MSQSVFIPPLEAIPLVKSPDGDMHTKPFLEVCRMVLPVIDKFGAALSLVKTDIGGNISRLDACFNSNPTAYNLLYDIVREEITNGTAKKSSSRTNGLLWLTRAMDFLIALFRNLLDHPDWTMNQVASEAYIQTLKKWHGWIASGAFTIALKLVPDRSKFMTLLGEGDLEADMKNFIALFSPLLQDNHEFLKSVGCDDLKAS